MVSKRLIKDFSKSHGYLGAILKVQCIIFESYNRLSLLPSIDRLQATADSFDLLFSRHANDLN